MLKNQLKVVLRSLAKGNIFSLVNIVGLGVSICAFLLIIEYVYVERSYDNFHKNGDRIYRVQYEKLSADDHNKSAGLAAGAGPDLKMTYPEIEHFVRLWNTRHLVNLLRVNENAHISEKLHYAENGFFNLFDFEFLYGDGAKSLLETNSIVITETLARNLFGRSDVMGEIIAFSNGMSEGPMQVTGVLKDLPNNTHFDFEALLSYETLIESSGGTAANTYNWNAFPTYLLLKEGINVEELEAKLPGFVEQHYTDLIAQGIEVNYLLRPLEDIHLHSNVRMELGVNGDHQIVKVLLAVGILILGLSYFNYINLTTSLVLKRGREIGVRKVAGATKAHLFSQFLMEAFVFNTLGLIMGFTLLQFSKPFFINLTGVSLQDNAFGELGLFPILALVLVIGTLFSGLYPAIIMSRQNLAESLKGQKGSKGKTGLLNKALVVLQFVILCFLLIGSLVVKKQIDFMLDTDWGFDAETAIVVKGPAAGNNIYKEFDAFKDDLSQLSGVNLVSQSTAVPGKEITWINTSIRLYGTPKSENKSIHFMGISENFIESLGLNVLAGRNFNRLLSSDTSNLILNKTAVKTFGFSSLEDALEQKIRVGGKPMVVVGVVDDYMQGSFKSRVNPTAYTYSPWANNYFIVKTAGASSGLIDQIEDVYRSSFPNSPFEYFYLDEFFQRQFEQERAFGKIINLFTALGIWISCLGLIGLTTFAVIQRRKELGIRKVLGATPGILMLLMSRNMLLMNLISFFISIPITYYVTRSWLMNYALATDLSVWVFLIPAFIVVALTLVTTVGLSLKTSLMNPAASLKYE